MEDAHVTPFPLTGPGQRLYTNPSHDEMAEGLRDRGLQSLRNDREPPPPVEDKPVKIGRPRGKKRKPQPMQVAVKEPPKPKTDRQEFVSTLLELTGITIVTAGVALISVAAALIVLGVSFVLLGLALG